MTANGVAQLLFYLVVLVALAKPLGAFMARVYEGRPCGLDGALGWLERLIYRVAGVRPGDEMGWKTYAMAMLLFNAAGMVFVYALQRAAGRPALQSPGLRGGVCRTRPSTRRRASPPIPTGRAMAARAR